MAGTGETEDVTYVYVVVPLWGGGEFHVFSTFDDIVRHYRILELPNQPYTAEMMENEKKEIESTGEMRYISLDELGEQMIQIFRARSHIPPRGGRRSRRTFRRNNTLHRNVRRHHIK